MNAFLLRVWAEDSSLPWEDRELLIKSADQIDEMGQRALAAKDALKAQQQVIETLRAALRDLVIHITNCDDEQISPALSALVSSARAALTYPTQDEVK